jgi:hypothetical protein
MWSCAERLRNEKMSGQVFGVGLLQGSPLTANCFSISSKLSAFSALIVPLGVWTDILALLYGVLTGKE